MDPNRIYIVILWRGAIIMSETRFFCSLLCNRRNEIISASLYPFYVKLHLRMDFYRNKKEVDYIFQDVALHRQCKHRFYN